MAPGTVLSPSSILATISAGVMATSRASPGLCPSGSLGSMGICMITSSPFALASLDTSLEYLMLGITAMVSGSPMDMSSLTFLMSWTMSSMTMASLGFGGAILLPGGGSGGKRGLSSDGAGGGACGGSTGAAACGTLSFGAGLKGPFLSRP